MIVTININIKIDNQFNLWDNFSLWLRCKSDSNRFAVWKIEKMTLRWFLKYSEI